MTSVQKGALPAEDAKYVAATVAAKAGITPEEAEARVKATYDRLQSQLLRAEVSAKQAADTARKTSTVIVGSRNAATSEVTDCGAL